MALASGTKIGPYEIVSLIGAGGMGEVYRARDSRLRREVAVKVLPPSFAKDTERLRRFEQEARMVGALNHPNILAIFDVGAQDGVPYLVSELLEGQSLREHMQGTPLPQRKAVDYGVQIARGLAAAHEKGVVHRDLKPDNIFVLNDGRIKILDFGLAKLLHDDALSSHPDLQTVDQEHPATTPGHVMGTVGYMSPEQVRGQGADQRSDIFALGAILYEILTGKRAFKRDSSVETMNAILKEEPPELEEVVPGLTPGLDRVVRHCLEKNPVQRFQSASDVAFDLETISGHSGTGSRLKAVAAERQGYWKPVAGALLVAAALAATYYLAGKRAPVAAPRFHQLTFQRGTIYGAKFAPDGESILFSAAWNGAPKPQIYTTRTDALMSRPIDLLDSQVLGISSKGEMAIRQKTENGQIPQGMLSVVPLTGGAPRELLADVIDASWNPGGDGLVAVHAVAGETRLEYPIGKTLVSTSTGSISDAAISPDGKMIAYFDHPNAGDTRGYVAVTDLTGKAKRLTAEWSDLTGLAWSRSGNEIWFTGSDAGINSALYAVDLNGKQRDLLHIPGRLHLFDISKEGQVLITNEASRLETYGRHAGQDKDIDLSWFDWTIGRAISNDGQWVVLEEDGEGGGPNYSIFVRKTDGSAAIRLGSGMGLGISPDGKWVASTSVKQPAPTILLPTGAGQPITLADGRLFHSQRLTFLPNGKGVVMIAAEPGKDPRTYVQMLDGTGPTALGPEGFRGFAVSPDGKSILGRKDRSIWIFPMSGPGPGQPLPSVAPDELASGWTADGHSIYVLNFSTMPAKAYVMDINTGQRKLHHEFAPADPSGVPGVGGGVITPDGKFYMYAVPRTLSYLYVVEGLK
ncbi:MAG: protein kinase domain-containing protein [Terriglobales bacterium]